MQGMQESLPRKLRLLRAERGLTLEEAARETGVTRETLGLLERGKRHPHAPTLSKIAHGYEVSVEDLLNLEEPALAGKDEAPSTETAEAGRSDEEQRTARTALEGWVSGLRRRTRSLEEELKDEN